LLGGGAGRNGRITPNMRARPPVGVQFASAIRPPGRVTRASSRALASWSGENITPQVEETASKLASPTSSCSQSPMR
jgi:hypothetical protein